MSYNKLQKKIAGSDGFGAPEMLLNSVPVCLQIDFFSKRLIA
jgi:hypothetical protein